MNKSDHARWLNPYMAQVNERWASRVLGIPQNGYNNGPDLRDDRVSVEIKGRLAEYYKSWTAFSYQERETHGVPGFWGLCIYDTDVPFEKINNISLDYLEERITSRTLTLVSLDWAKRFKSCPVSGQTEKSKWEYEFKYLKKNQLPPVVKEIKVEKGLVLLTEGVPEELFPNIGIKQLIREETPF